jgi:peptide chain release factor 1
LIDELERSYTEVQERMSDPSVYNDHREAAEVGRRLKELETPYKLAQEWRSMREDVTASLADPELKELVAESETRLAEIEEELKLALVENDPADQKDVIVEFLQAAADLGGLPMVVVDRRVRHALLYLGVRPLELVDQVFECVRHES